MLKAYSTFFEADFCSKIENSPPPKGFGSWSCEGHAVIWTRVVELFGSEAHPKSVKTFFFFLWRSLVFGRKNLLNFWFPPEKAFEFRWRPCFFFVFFWDHLIFTEKLPQSNSRLMKIWIKFVYGWIKLPKKPPPPFVKSWLRAWLRLESKTFFCSRAMLKFWSNSTLYMC